MGIILFKEVIKRLLIALVPPLCLLVSLMYMHYRYTARQRRWKMENIEMRTINQIQKVLMDSRKIRA